MAKWDLFQEGKVGSILIPLILYTILIDLRENITFNKI